MANKPIKQTLLNSFADQISEDYQKVYSKEYTVSFIEKKDPNLLLQSFVYYLIKRGLITTERARNYTIVRDYQKFVLHLDGKKTEFCAASTDYYDLSDKQIQNIITKYLPKFFLEKHIDYSK